jgi:hypothetical protein
MQFAFLKGLQRKEFGSFQLYLEIRPRKTNFKQTKNTYDVSATSKLSDLVRI